MRLFYDSSLLPSYVTSIEQGTLGGSAKMGPWGGVVVIRKFLEPAQMSPFNTKQNDFIIVQSELF